MKVIINRDIYIQDGCFGACYIQDQETCKTTYIGFSLSRLPIQVGIYKLVYEWSPRFKKMLWEVKGTGKRSEIKFHAMNYLKQSDGCIGLGNKRVDINKDGILDITSSRKTMAIFHKMLKGKTNVTLEISDV